MPEQTTVPRRTTARAVVREGSSPVVVVMVALTTFVVIASVVAAAALLWRAPARPTADEGRDSTATAEVTALDETADVAALADPAVAAQNVLGHATASACNDAAADGATMLALATSAVAPDAWIATGTVEPLVGVPFEELAVRCGSEYATAAAAVMGVGVDASAVISAHIANGGSRSAVDAAAAAAKLSAQLPPELQLTGDATQAVPFFALPSGNVVCEIVAEEARCDIATATYDTSDAPQDCPVGWAMTLAVGVDVAGPRCAGERPMPQAPLVLDYLQSTRVGGFSCSVAQSGVACRNDATGHGFWLRSEAYLTF